MHILKDKWEQILFLLVNVNHILLKTNNKGLLYVKVHKGRFQSITNLFEETYMLLQIKYYKV